MCSVWVFVCVSALQACVQSEVSAVVGREVDPDEPLMAAAGVDSRAAMELRSGLASAVGCALPPTLLYDYQSPSEIAVYISDTLELQEVSFLNLRSPCTAKPATSCHARNILIHEF